MPITSAGEAHFREQQRKYLEEYPENTTQEGVYSPRVPDLQIKVFKTEKPIPATVWVHLMDHLKLVAQGINPQMVQVAESLEESRIVIGLPDETEVLEKHLDHYRPTTEPYGRYPESPINEESRPVAQWHSGISSGYSQTLFLNPDGSFYYGSCRT